MSDRPRIEPDGSRDDEGRGRTGVERVGSGGASNAVRIVSVLAAALVVVAIWKPWELAAPPSTERPEGSPVARISPSFRPATPAAPTPTPERWDGMAYFHCLGYPQWLLVSDEVQTDGLRRTWSTAGVRIGTTSPDDPGIPWARIGAPSVPAIGVCVPGASSIPVASPDAATADTSIVVWAAGAGGWREVTVRLVDGDFRIAGGAIVAPASRDPAADGAGGWRGGRYVIEVRPGDGEPTAWLGVEIAGPPAGATGSDAPGGSPAPAATAVP